GPRTEKRKKKRYPGSFHVEVNCAAHGTPQGGVAVNIGEKGVGISGTKPLEPGSEVSITFHFDNSPGKKTTETVKGIVKWNQKMGPYYTSGVELEEPVNGNDHFMILSQIQMAKNEETDPAPWTERENPG
ncbi:MAG TPA: PilZ domain-containing protein, partial [Nitrospiria bacterium]|nr:PilZ domain-containing protein [Nitrospiria bacterium]